jgi:hypothetical protein
LRRCPPHPSRPRGSSHAGLRLTLHRGPPLSPLKGGEGLFAVNLRLRNTARVQSVSIPRTALRCAGNTCSARTRSEGAMSPRSSCPAHGSALRAARGQALAPRLSGLGKVVAKSPPGLYPRSSCPCLSRISTPSGAGAGSVDAHGTSPWNKGPRNKSGHDDLWLYRRYVRNAFSILRS